MLKISTLIFDWDGTLSDSTNTIVRTMLAAYKEADITAPSATAITEIIGLSLDHAVSRLSPELPAAQVRHVVSAYRSHYASNAVRPELFPGVATTLGNLYDQGYTLAVATGKSRRGLDRALEESNLQHLFSATRTADCCEPKPSPAMINDLLLEIDEEPAHVLMVGDTAFDLEMAVSAGVHRVGVSYGAHPGARLQTYEPLFILDEFGTLPAMLSGLNKVPRP